MEIEKYESREKELCSFFFLLCQTYLSADEAFNFLLYI